jgi:mitochondrial import inner membrane translocase subunit TIM10B
VKFSQFKDFLQLYNLVSETCFNNCVTSLHSRDLQNEEVNLLKPSEIIINPQYLQIQCVERCCGKFVRTNHAIMATFVEVQPQIVNKRIEEMTAANAAIQQQQQQQVTPAPEQTPSQQ